LSGWKKVDASLNSRLGDAMKIKRLVLFSCFALLSLTLAGSVAAGDAKSDEQALRDNDANWSKAAGAKDLGRTLSFYSEDAKMLPPNAPIATTKEAIRKIWKELLESPGLVISWKANQVQVAKSGDIGFVSGTYDVTTKEDGGEPVHDHGKYLEVWEKTNGIWNCTMDINNSDLPESAPSEKK
jgi:ketosteroid isomerase-like protein